MCQRKNHQSRAKSKPCACRLLTVEISDKNTALRQIFREADRTPTNGGKVNLVFHIYQNMRSKSGCFSRVKHKKHCFSNLALFGKQLFYPQGHSSCDICRPMGGIGLPNGGIAGIFLLTSRAQHVPGFSDCHFSCRLPWDRRNRCFSTHAARGGCRMPCC